jgi:hypothetical protein
LELLSAIKVVIISGKVVAIGDFFSVWLEIILLEDLPVSFDDGPYAAEMVLDEEVRLEGEATVTQFFPDDSTFGECDAFEDECAVVVVDIEAEGKLCCSCDRRIGPSSQATCQVHHEETFTISGIIDIFVGDGISK